MRSFLFVPGDSTRKYESAKKTDADALILDLEDSIAPDQKPLARTTTLAMLGDRPAGKKLYVRINALDTGLPLTDLAAIMPGKPDGIVLPKCAGAADVNQLGFWLDAFEAVHAIALGATRILPVATETADAVFKLANFAGASPRLWGLMWGAEDLAASLGASQNRIDGRFYGPFSLARNLCLMSAMSIGVVPVDTVYADIDNLAGLEEESIEARRDGFMAKAIIHPKHVDVVNKAFMPTDDEIALSQKIVAAFEQNPNSGVIRVEGKMVDKPHLSAALKILAQAGMG